MEHMLICGGGLQATTPPHHPHAPTHQVAGNLPERPACRQTLIDELDYLHPVIRWAGGNRVSVGEG